jgi:hypothetical protein
MKMVQNDNQAKEEEKSSQLDVFVAADFDDHGSSPNA